MTLTVIGVGLVGYEPGRSWGAVAHAPALRALPDYEIRAVATRRADSARAAADDLGLEKGYGDARALIDDPKVDLVVVTVKVPAHYEIVRAALEAGKHVYCEWPLALDLEEARVLAEVAKTCPGRVLIGTQARMAPAIRQACAMVEDGYVGEVLSTTLIGSGMQWGDIVDRPNAYIVDRINGATMLSIPLGHTLDALCHMLGEFRSLSATAAIRQAEVTLIETGETLTKTAYDQIVIGGELESGAVAAVHYRGGMPRGTGLLWEIQGSKGDLRISAMGGHAQIVEAHLWGARGEDRNMQPISPDPHHRWVPDCLTGPSVNVAQLYALFARDLREGTKTCPDFDDAVTRHRMLTAIETSVIKGQKVNL